MGWRNYFVYELENIKQADEVLAHFSPIADTAVDSITLSFSLSNISFNLTIIRVAKEDVKRTPGVLFDLDAFVKYDKPMPKTIVEQDILAIRKAIQSSDLLGRINDILV